MAVVPSLANCYRTEIVRSSQMKYSVALRRTEEGFSVSCPGFPGAGLKATEQEALDNIQSAIEEYLDARRDLLGKVQVREIEVPG